MARIIVCVDMDAFFASVEQRDRPELRGQPIAVTGGGERTVVTTSSYEARRYGVRTGMTVYQARRLCPTIIVVTGDNGKYARICRELEEICLRFTPDIEIYSIDEVFLDITGSHHLFGGPESLARALKDQVKEGLGLACTVGIGPNILVAKLASDLAKPNGLRWITEELVASVFETLPVRKLWGIGSHTEEKLRAMGITTCGALAQAPLERLTKKFGVLGERLRTMGAGQMERPIEVAPQEPKSIGHSVTLPEDIREREEMARCLLRLAERVGRRARRYGYEGRRITLTVRYGDFKTFTKQATVPVATNDTGEIYRAAVAILDRIRLRAAVRLLGIALSSLEKGDGQMSLFAEKDRERKAALARAVDAVNDRFGEEAITYAAAVTQEKGQRVISPAWRPSGVRNSDV